MRARNSGPQMVKNYTIFPASRKDNELIDIVSQGLQERDAVPGNGLDGRPRSCARNPQR